jgi:hypothetical protein
MNPGHYTNLTGLINGLVIKGANIGINEAESQIYY